MDKIQYLSRCESASCRSTSCFDLWSSSIWLKRSSFSNSIDFLLFETLFWFIDASSSCVWSCFSCARDTESFRKTSIWSCASFRSARYRWKREWNWISQFFFWEFWNFWKIWILRKNPISWKNFDFVKKFDIGKKFDDLKKFYFVCFILNLYIKFWLCDNPRFHEKYRLLYNF